MSDETGDAATLAIARDKRDGQNFITSSDNETSKCSNFVSDYNIFSNICVSSIINLAYI